MKYFETKIGNNIAKDCKSKKIADDLHDKM